MSSFHTVFASLDDYVKGSVEIVNGDPRHYALSRCLRRGRPFEALREKVVVGLNPGLRRRSVARGRDVGLVHGRTR